MVSALVSNLEPGFGRICSTSIGSWWTARQYSVLSIKIQRISASHSLTEMAKGSKPFKTIQNHSKPFKTIHTNHITMGIMIHFPAVLLFNLFTRRQLQLRFFPEELAQRLDRPGPRAPVEMVDFLGAHGLRC